MNWKIGESTELRGTYMSNKILVTFSRISPNLFLYIKYNYYDFGLIYNFQLIDNIIMIGIKGKPKNLKASIKVINKIILKV